MAFDFSKVVAEAPKSRKKPFQFDWDDKTYALSAEADLVAIRAASERDLLTAFRRLLGPDQYAEFVLSPTMLLPSVLNDIMEEYFADVYGETAGKSSASSRSSKSTARQSNTTSKSAGTSRSRRS